ncbi:MAG: hypothetical protein BRD55_02235 [Bacteroidetes bacterium SW_9_63_38]|nr:MAG: hypothetical protein BRD55_02235 [Bacteroidetes bacterium SW_9_63_38]
MCSLPAAAVLRDGAVGATRWAFAALACQLARDGHCTLVRTRQRRWWGPTGVATVDLHADPTVLSSFEQTVLRQLGRHDTLNGFGFAGSTFRRRTLRDVRADLVEKGELVDRSRRSTACVLLGGVLLVTSGVGLGMSGPVAWGGTGLGAGLGMLGIATVRYPCTEAGARIRAAHRASAEQTRNEIEDRLSTSPARAAALLVGTLPALVLERIATPRWLHAVADAVEGAEGGRLDWIQDEGEPGASLADDLRTLAAILKALGAGPWWVNLW